MTAGAASLTVKGGIAMHEVRMFVLWPNFITLVCAGLVGSVIGFIIYGCIKGFENTFKDD